MAAIVSIVGLLAGMASIASARDRATSKVSIEAEQGGFFGYLSSPRHNPCELNRKVLLYKQKGDHQNRGVDTLIGSDLAQPNGPDSQWNVNTNQSGRFYAFTKQTAQCQADFSRTVHSE